jgi:DNA-binding NarL/FixJ family response regulator
VALRPPQRTRPIRVALSVADRALQAYIVDACEDADIAVADPDEAVDGADIVVADRPVETTAPVIVLASAEERETWRETRRETRSETWATDVRAVVPADIDAATLGAVIAVVAAGLAVMPRGEREETDGPETEDAWADPVDGADELPIALTPREREVLALLAEGASNKAIARALAVSVHTAKFHVASLTEKLGAHGRLEAVAIAIRAGLVMV